MNRVNVRPLDRLIDRLARAAAEKLQRFVPDRLQGGNRSPLLLYEAPEVMRAVASDPLFRKAVEMVADDPDLGRIAPLGAYGPNLIAVSSSPRISANDLVPALIGAAALELRCLALEPTAANLSAISRTNVARVRQVARGEPLRLVTYLGFSRVSLPTGRIVDLPWGRLTAPVGWYGISETFLEHQSGCVLAAEHDVLVDVRDLEQLVEPTQDGVIRLQAMSRSEVPDSIQKEYQWTLHTIQMTGLAVMLGTPNGRPAPLPTFQLTVLPYESPTAGSAQMVLAPPAADRVLTNEGCNEIERWGRLLNERYSDKLDVAARRILVALSQRLDPNDRLIDAVIAWESLFGASQDATLRVTGAIAWLLEPDRVNERGALRDELARIYALRSRVVHGGHEDPEVVWTASFRATEIAIALLQTLLERRPELIPITASDRSRRLLLGLP